MSKSRKAIILAWKNPGEISARLVPKLNLPDSARLVPEMAAAVPTALVMQIPWGHNAVLLFKLSEAAHRLWYMQQTIANGWSRNVLSDWFSCRYNGLS